LISTSPKLGGLLLLWYRLVMAFKRRPTSLDIVTVPIGSTAQQADRDYYQQVVPLLDVAFRIVPTTTRFAVNPPSLG
jgi:hypothetical protein